MRYIKRLLSNPCNSEAEACVKSILLFFHYLPTDIYDNDHPNISSNKRQLPSDGGKKKPNINHYKTFYKYRGGKTKE